jgi:hypothetical protein
MLTHDIKYQYVNIPLKKTLRIVEEFLKMNNINPIICREYKIILNTVLKQNYFRYNTHHYKSK